MNIGTHKGKRATYKIRNNRYTGYVFETITDEVDVLFVADEKHDQFHNARLYFDKQHPELWNEAYAKRCYWLKQNNYELAKKVLL